MHGRLLLLPLALAPIVRRADVPDARYLALGARHPAVVPLGRLGDATLVGDRWLLTAAHVAAGFERRPGAATVAIGDATYRVDHVAIHPAWRPLGPHDFALLRLDRPVRGVRPIPIYRGSAERGMVATLVGHGAAGTGDSRQRTDDGRRRAATSRVDSVAAAVLYVSFDAPPSGTALEGAPGAGDSGGPALIGPAGALRVAGVSSAGHDGRSGPASYGAIDVFGRVSHHAAWIDSVMAAPVRSRAATRAPEAPVRADSVLPDTPVGRRWAAFLRAARAPGDTAVAAFVTAHFAAEEVRGRPALVPNLTRLARAIHGATAMAVVRSEPFALTLRFATVEGPLTLELVASPDAPHRLVD